MADVNLNKIKNTANNLSEKMNADFLLYNAEMLQMLDFFTIGLVKNRKNIKKNINLILITEGGSADSAYRIINFIQGMYEKVTIIVPGWCKSAGTLMCVGAHELLIGAIGELGPLDVQITKADELGEASSGVAIDNAFEKLRAEAATMFSSLMEEVAASKYRITLRTASHLATELTTGFLKPIFEKLDPLAIGEDYRSTRIAYAYAERLNARSRSLIRTPDFDGLMQLIYGYPSHGFVIDIEEAKRIFRNVNPIPTEMETLIALLDSDAIIPRNRSRGQEPKVEFLNADQDSASITAAESAQSTPTASTAAPKGGRGRHGTDDITGNIKTGSEEGQENETNGQAKNAS